jgi:predicted DNA-binding transcriptional regulator AlpA
MSNTENPAQINREPVQLVQLPAEGFVRINQILAPKGPIPVARSTWWAGVKSGRFPQPKRLFGERITVWAVEDIRAFIASGITTEYAK